MRQLPLVLLVACVLVAPGCQRKSGASPADDSAVQPVVHWSCDGGLSLTTKYLPRDRAISLGLHEGERKLTQVVAASGEKYQEGPITFWAKGATATYERTPAPPVQCRRTDG